MVSAGTGSEPDLFWIEPLTAVVGAVGGEAECSGDGGGGENGPAEIPGSLTQL